MRRKFDPKSTYGRWTILSSADRSATGDLRWNCRCTCGSETIVLQRTLLNGTSKSCGCLSVETFVASTSERRRSHGQTVGGYTPEYRAWLHMRGRCKNPNVKKFKNHGGRGIRVCERWDNSFEAFFADMGPRPSPRHSIDREDNDGNYEPGNCRWALPRTQQGNKSNNIHVIVGIERLALKHACERFGLDPRLVYLRLSRGWRLVDAVSRPKGRNGGAATLQPMSLHYTEGELRIAFAGAGTQAVKMMMNRVRAA